MDWAEFAWIKTTEINMCAFSNSVEKLVGSDELD